MVKTLGKRPDPPTQIILRRFNKNRIRKGSNEPGGYEFLASFSVFEDPEKIIKKLKSVFEEPKK